MLGTPTTTILPSTLTSKISPLITSPPTVPSVIQQIVTSCQQNICFNGGSCYIVSQSGFICICPVGYSGDMCQFCRQKCFPLCHTNTQHGVEERTYSKCDGMKGEASSIR